MRGRGIPRWLLLLGLESPLSGGTSENLGTPGPNNTTGTREKRISSLDRGPVGPPGSTRVGWLHTLSRASRCLSSPIRTNASDKIQCKAIDAQVGRGRRRGLSQALSLSPSHVSKVVAGRTVAAPRPPSPVLGHGHRLNRGAAIR
ncbi:hypothetical protein B0T25DRAFT_195798 [Lasiosphaeria hispida]|uniref:Secreted protein n=1 Tax=Lasiosphaeria hispida TaxID=260671 RepID=A0AAJ0HI64_9PEZI|nr:hypothetical protein B0T25DRAFT_195798 [Lasiosphaeria hispida]